MPMRSVFRRATKSLITCFDTASLFFGWKSSASIERDTSMVIMMSTPRFLTLE